VIKKLKFISIIHKIIQDRQLTYNLTLGRVRAAIVAAEEQ